MNLGQKILFKICLKSCVLKLVPVYFMLRLYIDFTYTLKCSLLQHHLIIATIPLPKQKQQKGIGLGCFGPFHHRYEH